MAEGVLGGLLGGEDEGPEFEGTAEALIGAEAFAAAVAAEQGRHDPEVARATTDFLKDQSDLLKTQAQHLRDEHQLRLSHLRNQSSEGKLRRAGLRLRLGMQVVTGAIVTAFALGIGATVWQAAHDHGLVVDTFSVPPDLAQRGLTGQVLARQVLDRLAQMQAQSASMRAAASYDKDWGEALKVEIPETGVSLDELQRFLSGWLGHQTHITGEVYRTPAGLTLTTRAGEETGASFSGADAELDKLVERAAESVYEQTQPYRYAVYLRNHHRDAESVAVLQALTRSPDRLERAWAHVGLSYEATRQSDNAGYARELRAALAEEPGFAPALSDLTEAEQGLGHDRLAADVAEDYLRAAGSQRRDIEPALREALRQANLVTLDWVRGDYLGAERSDRAEIADAPEWLRSQAITNLATLLALDHDPEGARAAVREDPDPHAVHFGDLALAALDDGDPAAVALWSRQSDADVKSGAGGRDVMLRQDAPWLAIAEARFGDAPGAWSLVGATPLDCYLCVRARGVVAAAKGDRREADRWFAEAIRQAPELPQAYAERGAARLAWADLDGALADARRSHELSPNYADAMKLWGDALARQGRWREAQAKYDAALQLAPAWPGLHKARDLTARKL